MTNTCNVSGEVDKGDRLGNLLNVYRSNFRCRLCQEEKPLTGSGMVAGIRVCAHCWRFIQAGKDENARPPDQRGAKEERTKQPRGTVKWWDAKAREWRWVSKRSKPELKPYDY